MKNIKKLVKGVFKPPRKLYYIGKIQHGSPYFYPLSFERYIFNGRILERKSEKEYNEYIEKYPHLKDKPSAIFSNLPMVRRNKNWIFKLFKRDVFLQIGWPIAIKRTELGWKDKYNSPRFEWSPSFQIYLFNFQFCIWWNAPQIDITDTNINTDLYYEMILWWANYSDKDIKKAEKTWGWLDIPSGKTTWRKEYLL